VNKRIASKKESVRMHLAEMNGFLLAFHSDIAVTICSTDFFERNANKDLCV
jgi:hypothetical protein